jgi:hypothetical protein
VPDDQAEPVEAGAELPKPVAGPGPAPEEGDEVAAAGDE